MLAQSEEREAGVLALQVDSPALLLFAWGGRVHSQPTGHYLTDSVHTVSNPILIGFVMAGPGVGAGGLGGTPGCSVLNL